MYNMLSLLCSHGFEKNVSMFSLQILYLNNMILKEFKSTFKELLHLTNE